MTNSTLTLASIAILGLLVFLLGANVTRIRAQRGATGTQMPTDPADRLLIAQRAHGNAAEYAPMLAVLLVVASVQTDGWWVPALAVVAVLARLLHAVGMLRSTTLATHGPLRDAGAMGTYLVGIALSVTILVAAL
jgi:uncharacterized protein